MTITAGLQAVMDLSYDWITGNLYVADIGLEQIIACSTRTRRCSDVIQRTSVRVLAIDPLAQYASVVRGIPRIFY